MANLIKLGQGTADGYAALQSKDQYQVYFTTDTHQIFVGADEYTKGTKTLNAVPSESTPGDKDRLYFVNNSLYLCEGEGSTAGTYVWTRVANVNDFAGVTSVAAGEGLETADGQAITETGTISHSVPTGASTYTDALTDQTPALSGSFSIVGVSTDKFGHVTGINTHSVTLPDETAVSVGTTAAASQTLGYGDSFTVVSNVAKGDGSHELVETTTSFTLPASDDTTYTISSTEEGIVTLTDSNANATTALINGWGDLAKKSELSAVFKYKGSVATVSALPAAAEVGDVYQVVTGAQGTSEEYVCVTAGDGSTTTAQYEELGPTINLDPYATTAYVQDALTWRTF